MAVQTLDLWSLTRDRPEIDPYDLAEAILSQVEDEPLDYRTRLLVRDSLRALTQHWGESKVQTWLVNSSKGQKIQEILKGPFDIDEIGFPSLMRRVMDKTGPDKVRQYLEHLGKQVRSKLRLYIGGSIALILPGYLSRHTEDIDVVGEVPQEIRNNHRLLADLEKSYGLQLGHVQSHYFPSGWQNRAHSQEEAGRLEIFLVDVYDVFLSKLFSVRLKDLDDLRLLAPQLDREILKEKLLTTAQGFLAAPDLRDQAASNWRILFGEDLPS